MPDPGHSRNDPFHRNNHYVPRLYLKRWSSSKDLIWTYRTLVSNSRVPLWKESSIRGVAYHSHLYTRIAAGNESDVIEKWLDREFEAPAEEAIIKATTDQRLTPEDWKCLVRFLAAQDVRTPTSLAEALIRWETEIPNLLEQTVSRAVRRLEDAKASGVVLGIQEPDPNRDTFPLRVTAEPSPNPDNAILKTEIVAGRALWLFSMSHLLENTAKVLHQHKWTILSPPKGLTWVTSDDPVVCLYYRGGRYDFKGGWKKPGTDIFLPLGPHHLLYTEVGKRPPKRGSIIQESGLLHRFIVEHAHRMIFSVEPSKEVSQLRPRRVDADAFASENEFWKQWHEGQARAEREISKRPKQ